MRAIMAGAAMLMAGQAMAADIPPGASTAARVRPGESGKGSQFDYAGDQDAFRVRLEKGKTYGAYAQTWCHGKTLTLLDRGFRPIGASTPPKSAQEAWTEVTPRYTGLHYLTIRDLGVDPSCGDESSVYDVMATETCGSNRRTQCALRPGQTVAGAVWSYADREWWRLPIATAGTYKIVGMGDASGNGWNWGGTISLRRSDTTVIAESGRGDGFSCDDGLACIRARLEPGLHYVALRMPLELNITAYQLTVELQ